MTVRDSFPEVGPRGGRFRIERRQCPCGAWHDSRLYQSRNHNGYDTDNRCLDCKRAAMGNTGSPCPGCGVHGWRIGGPLVRCDACEAAWKCEGCGRREGDPGRFAPCRRSRRWQFCAACERRYERHKADPIAGLRPSLRRFGFVFFACLDEQYRRARDLADLRAGLTFEALRKRLGVSYLTARKYGLALGFTPPRGRRPKPKPAPRLPDDHAFSDLADLVTA